MAKIAILLATYNGELYLAQQIESIISQSFKDWLLYIRDDGSTDLTLDIIEEYRKKYMNIIILEDSQKHRGAMNSFIWMMKNVESEYYMFCDQDDVWLPRKVEISYYELLKIENKNLETPALVFSDLFIVDETLKTISDSMWDYTRLNRIMDSKYLLVNPIATGCTMLFNKKARLVSLKYLNKAIMHDSLLALSVLLSGGIIKGIPCSLIYYRQHSTNTLGVTMFTDSIVYRIINVKKIIRRNYKYFIFVNSINSLSLVKFLLIKMEAAFKTRNIFRKIVNV